ncbi:MAG: 2,3-bisphosphoglycerate-independent phosphoglycerate mutase [Firmicutes bacterium]|nr:2,3-bisphosphoglycerate-independent phosphoglycerate mutase [Alicyclobacillaceae bacterium]MCL6498008.1 2,3-bisphosphoglycerate-independent phosphoglycerate mutase [Bacillota bacterium]
MVLMVLDGWGVAPPGPCNAIALAPDQNLERLGREYWAATLVAHGSEVGLLPGQMGDSNVGHLTIGAGRVVDQNLTRIHKAIANGSFGHHPVIQELAARGRSGRVHLLGLLSPGGVHSHEEHLAALLEVLAAAEARSVFLHLWLDGRDVPPQSALASLEYLAGVLARTGVGQVATVSGRYYAMDRDRRWERTEKAYRAMVEGVGPTARSAVEAVTQSYQAGVHDEFVVPTVLVDAQGEPVGRIGPQDSVFVWNFRADRVRQITRALADPGFDAFPRPFPAVGWIGGMALYDEAFVLPHVLEPQSVPNNLAEWLSRLGVPQLHVAETEKYAHVTFFFNGGVERQYPGEDRRLIPSPKVATYDLQPEMSAPAIADVVVEAIRSGRYGFILLNFANSDMVGHTGNLEATRTAIQVVDREIGRIAEATLEAGGQLMVVADHGNAEVMCDGPGEVNTNHTTNPVPAVVVSKDPSLRGLRDGALKDVAPTVLDLMGLPIPPEMEGRSLVCRAETSTHEGGQP